MKTGMRAIIVALALLAGFYFATALLANIGGLAAVADRVRAGSGDYVFWILCVALAVLLAAPVVLFFAQPPALVAPHSAEGPEYEAFRRAFAARLKANPLLAGAPIESEAQMADACARLNIAAEAAIKETASTVFVSTAIMQNGRLVEGGPVRQILHTPQDPYTQMLLSSMLEGKPPMTQLLGSTVPTTPDAPVEVAR